MILNANVAEAAAEGGLSQYATGTVTLSTGTGTITGLSFKPKAGHIAVASSYSDILPATGACVAVMFYGDTAVSQTVKKSTVERGTPVVTVSQSGSTWSVTFVLDPFDKDGDYTYHLFG